MNNTILQCYGSLRDRQQEIENEFRWERILDSVLTQAPGNPTVFEAWLDDQLIASISAYGREIVIHPSRFDAIDNLLPLLEQAVSESMDCKCAINWHQDCIQVLMYKPEQRAFDGIHTGDLLTFGSFSQSEAREKQKISWRVLDVSKDEAILISEKALLRSGYCDMKKSYGNPWYLMWGNSLARELCNGVFYQKAFNHNEKQCIVPQLIESVEYGPVCTDEVFLLSEAQARLFFKDETDRFVQPSNELIALEQSDSEMRLCHGFGGQISNVSWWLLPKESVYPNNNPEIYPNAVWPDGSIQFHGRNIYHLDFTIRPTIVVRLSERFRRIIASDEP